jgi:hypothetical protein
MAPSCRRFGAKLATARKVRQIPGCRQGANDNRRAALRGCLAAAHGVTPETTVAGCYPDTIMDASIKDWLLGFTCFPCRTEVSSERRAGVLVVVQEAGHDPEVIPFRYHQPGTYVSRWADPSPTTSVRDAMADLGHAALFCWRTLAKATLGSSRGGG